MGGYCTHGEVLLNPDLRDEQIDDAVLSWAKGRTLHGESPERIRFLKSVVESLPGPLEPYRPGPGDLTELSGEEAEQVIRSAPGNLGNFLRLMLSMSEREHWFQTLSEYVYSGCVPGRVWLFYYANDCFCRVCPPLPEGKTYTVEVIDAWDMTREVVETDARPGTWIRLPGREYIALLATVNDVDRGTYPMSSATR